MNGEHIGMTPFPKIRQDGVARAFINSLSVRTQDFDHFIYVTYQPRKAALANIDADVQPNNSSDGEVCLNIYGSKPILLAMTLVLKPSRELL